MQPVRQLGSESRHRGERSGSSWTPAYARAAAPRRAGFRRSFRVGGVRVAQVVQPRIRHDPRSIARTRPKPVDFVLGQRSVSPARRKHPLAGCGLGKIAQQLPRRLAEQNVPRPGLGVNESE